MPTYQYACSDCDHAFEQVQSFTDDSLTTCPQCEGRLRKIFNAVGVVFKGSGFYRTDSRADAKPSTPESSSAKETSSSASETSGSSSSSSDSTKTSTSPAPAKNEAGAA